jgi:hypothetical protein
MEVREKKVLLFIKSPGQNLKSVESFLKKRNFEIHTSTDLQEALAVGMEIKPDFVFIAWDHTSPNIVNLPKLFMQTVVTQVVPYVMHNNRESMRKLSTCPLNPKLYPPLSGPAIERLVLKISKQQAEEEASIEKVKSKISAKKESEMIQITSKLKAPKAEPNFNLGGNSANSSIDQSQPNNRSDQTTDSSTYNKFQSAHKSAQINSILDQGKDGYLIQPSLTDQLKTSLKNTTDSKIKVPLENILNTLAENTNPGFDLSSLDPTLAGSKTSGIMQEGKGTGSFKKATSAGNGNMNLGTQIEKSVTAGTESHFATASGNGSMNLGTQIESRAEANGDLNDFNKVFKENSVHEADLSSAKLRSYCMAVFSHTWCGYVLLTTEATLDFSTADLVFSEWYKEHFENFLELEESDFFEFRLLNKTTLAVAANEAEYSDTIDVCGYETHIHFFTEDPNNMSVNKTSDGEFIKVPTKDIPINEDLEFSVHLYLIENKKYLLYTQAYKQLSEIQKQRLVSNQIQTVFTPTLHEYAYKKFLAENSIRRIVSKFKDSKAS